MKTKIIPLNNIKYDRFWEMENIIKFIRKDCERYRALREESMRSDGITAEEFDKQFDEAVAMVKRGNDE